MTSIPGGRDTLLFSSPCDRIREYLAHQVRLPMGASLSEYPLKLRIGRIDAEAEPVCIFGDLFPLKERLQ